MYRARAAARSSLILMAMFLVLMLLQCLMAWREYRSGESYWASVVCAGLAVASAMLYFAQWRRERSTEPRLSKDSR